MPFRVSLFTQQQSTKLGGWGENFWNSTADLSRLIGSPPTPSNPAGQPGLVENLRLLVNQMKGAQAWIPSARISAYPTIRQIQNIKFLGASPSAPSSSNPDADYPSTALQIRLTSTSGVKTTQWIRGIPDGIVAKSGTYQPQNLSYYKRAENELFAFLSNTSNGFCVNVLNPANLPAIVTAFNFTTGVITAPGHNMTPLNAIVKVRLRGVGTGNPANGLWNVTVTDANTLTIANWTVPFGTWGITGRNPKVQLQAHVMQPIQKGEVTQASSHYTGKPSGLLGGRRRRRRT